MTTRDDKDLANSFKKFVKGLEALSKKHGISLDIVGGVTFHDSISDIKYTDDHTTNDLMVKTLKECVGTNKSQEILSLMDEGQHYKTKVKSVKESVGSRNIRNLLEQCTRYTANMLNENHPSPNPKDERSRALLETGMRIMAEAVPMIKKVKDTRRKK
jgi:hypothetical protein